MKKTIGIIGYGFVGEAVYTGFTNKDTCIKIYDTAKFVDGLSVESLEELQDRFFIFVCLPTPSNDNGSPYIEDIAKTLETLHNSPTIKNQTIILKSTVTPDKLEELAKSYPNIIYNPEFLVQKHNKEDFLNMRYVILGGKEEVAYRVRKLYGVNSNINNINDISFHYCTLREASFIKYTINCFLACKVTFFNCLYDIIGDDSAYNEVITGLGFDGRIGHSHMVMDSTGANRGYSGACFPKDMEAFREYSNGNLESLLSAVIDINNKYRSTSSGV